MTIRKHPKLYSRTTTGAIQVWWAESEANCYRTCYGQQDGKMVETAWTECFGKNKGKANETEDDEQMLREVHALYKKQLKSNYFYTVEDVDRGFQPPQLAKPNKEYIDKVDWSKGIIVDHKLNGFCCIITKAGAFTRTNEQYHSIPHITKELEPFFEKYPNAYLHGELFNPLNVTLLNRLAKLVAVTRKEADITPELLAESEKIVQYHIYDGYGWDNVTQDTIGRDRRKGLLELMIRSKFTYCFPITFTVVHARKEMEEFCKAYMATGGEGGIIRNPDAPYVHKRTKDLLKYKKGDSAEFKILYLEQGTGNWAGYAKAAWCELPDGKRDKRFKTNIKGGRVLQKEMWENQNDYPGKWITVDFQEYSEYGVPQIPYTDLVVRDEVEGKEK